MNFFDQNSAPAISRILANYAFRGQSLLGCWFLFLTSWLQGRREPERGSVNFLIYWFTALRHRTGRLATIKSSTSLGT